MDNIEFWMLDAPRGIRNRNPGNIISGKTRWQGMAPSQDDPRFVVFTGALWGLRALMKTLLTYYRRHGLDTVQSLINRWAPPHENATDHYAHHVASFLGISRIQPIRVDDEDTLVKLAQAIVLHENGRAPWGKEKNWYPLELYRDAVKLALKEEKKT